MAWSQMQALTFFGAVVLAPWQNGLMTIYFSGSHEHNCWGTTSVGMYGGRRYRQVEGIGRVGVDYGTGGRTFQMDPQRSSMKIAVPPSPTLQMFPPVQSMITLLPMRTPTSTKSHRFSVSDGNPPSPSPSGKKSHTWVFAGTCARAGSISSKRRDSSIWQRSRTGKRCARTTSWTPSEYMESFFTPRWSCLQGELTSQTWRPYWPSSVMVLSYHTPLHGILQAIYSGGDGSYPAATSQGPSKSPPHPLTIRRIQTPARGSELPLQLVPDGVRGNLSQGGSPKGGTSNGRKLSDSSSSSEHYAKFRAEASRSQFMGTTVGSSRDGGNAPAPTNQQTASSVAFLSLSKKESQPIVIL